MLMADTVIASNTNLVMILVKQGEWLANSCLERSMSTIIMSSYGSVSNVDIA